MMKVGKIICALLIFATLSACSTRNVEGRRDQAASIAHKSGFQLFNLQTKKFNLVGYFKRGKDTSNPVVYIEGDGFAWIDKYTISRNPTPRNPLALKLATKDSSSTVIYLARPCQYADLSKERYCSQKYWTNARFAQDVIDSFDEGLIKIKKKLKSDGFHLVGFSGGGAVAALLTAKRDDIKSLRTIAGNLDHVSLNKFKKVSPLSGSLNAINIANQINDIPQIHFSGSKDTTVPKWVAASFVKAARAGACVTSKVVRNAKHVSGWTNAWPSLHKKLPQC